MFHVKQWNAQVLQVPHGFLGRQGGVSQGVTWGLNVGLGSDDDQAAVRENRRRALEAVAPGRKPVCVYQVHGPECVTVREPWPDEARPRADAMVTGLPGVALGIITADCAPVLLADAKAGVIGAAHAGWKGAVTGVVGAAVVAMRALGAQDIAAAVGPCIAQASYEVDAAFRRHLLDECGGNAAYFAPGCEPRWQFDLEGYVAGRLHEAGVERVERLRLDTYTNEEQFFSYRRATHRGEPDYGRQMSIIALP